ncbi:MAG: T9SS type A sorting domain-containing protein [Lewinellaceae bacterium]|nr:T9SS type A sorting domain-containing protein [Lewinellaceae bacterium]
MRDHKQHGHRDCGLGGGILNDLGTLAVANSEISGNTAVRAGGGIEDNSLSGKMLDLFNITLTGNSTGSAPGNGGGLHITGPGNSTITGGMINDNFAALEGGGLWNGTGIMTVTGATISGNTAAGATAGDGGGGIFNNGGTVNVSMSTVSNNAATGADGSGGGLFNSTGGNFTLMLSTISGNSAAAGGGILNAGNAFEINATTIAMNAATAVGGGVNATSPAMLKNTIVASNTAAAGADVAGIFMSGNYNLIGSDAANVFPEQPGDIEGQDAKLMPLSTNGMATATHRLDIGSPAYNSGDPADNFADQNGQAVFAGRRDIGSDESQADLTNTVVVSLSESGIRVFPNPAQSQTTVSIPATFGSNTRLELFELGSGKLVRQYSGVSGTAQLDLGNLNAGMYTLRITSDTLITAGRVTVIR